MELSGRLVSAIATGCGLMVLAVGAYAYFPSPEEVFRDMSIIKADLYGEIGSESAEAPLHHLDLWDRQAAHLPIGATLRLAPPGDEARRQTEELRSSLRDLRQAVEARRRDEARVVFARAQKAYDRCREAYAVR